MTAHGSVVGRPIRLGVCVDDFGLNPYVNEAALGLACDGRISAVSCLVDAPAWRAGAALLDRRTRGRVDVGLHLNLTEAFDGCAPGHRGRLALGRCSIPAASSTA